MNTSGVWIFIFTNNLIKVYINKHISFIVLNTRTIQNKSNQLSIFQLSTIREPVYHVYKRSICSSMENDSSKMESFFFPSKLCTSYTKQMENTLSILYLVSKRLSKYCFPSFPKVVLTTFITLFSLKEARCQGNPLIWMILHGDTILSESRCGTTTHSSFI